MILVTGAAGKTGLAVIKSLQGRDIPVRAMIRREEQQALFPAGQVSEFVVGDMRDSEVVEEVVRGADAIYHICPNVHPDELLMARNFIRSAEKYRVRRFVYHSVLHPQVEAMPHHWLKMRVEETIFKSGLTFSILQPASYMQNILNHWEDIAVRGNYQIPYREEARLAMVDLQDVGECAAVVLTTGGHEFAIYELCSPDLLNQREIAQILANTLGREVTTERIDHKTWSLQAQERGLGKYQLSTLLKMFDYYDRYGFYGNPKVLNCLLGRAGTDFQSFVKRQVERMQPD